MLIEATAEGELLKQEDNVLDTFNQIYHSKKDLMYDPRRHASSQEWDKRR